MEVKLLAKIKRNTRTIQNLSGLAVLAGFAYYLMQRPDFFQQVWRIELQTFFILAILVLMSWVLISGQSLLLFRSLGSKITFTDSFLLSLAANFGNYLPMRVGSIIRMHYMQAAHQLPYTSFGSIWILRLMLNVFASGLIGLIACSYIYARSEINIMLLTAVFVGCLALPVGIWILSSYFSASKTSVVRKFLTNAHASFENIKANTLVVFLCLCLTVSQQLLLALRFYIAASAISLAVEPIHILVLVPLASIASFAAITPGALGVREGVMGLGSAALGDGLNSGLLIGSTDRIVMLVLTMVFGSLAFLWVWRKLDGLQRTSNGSDN